MIDAAEIRPEDLPASLGWIVEAVGLEASLAVVELYGGARMWVCARYTIDHPLVGRIGLPAASALAAAWEGTGMNTRAVEVPLMKAARTAARDRQIRERLAAGVPQSALAVEFDLSARRIRDIRKAGP